MQPKWIGVAGDWHGNQPWAEAAIRQMAGRLRDLGDRPVILQLGDFGIWPGKAGQRYLGAVNEALEAFGGQLWFIDGNHEDFPRLARMSGTVPDGRVIVRPNIFYLPRGLRWTWHERRWLACGGGVSLDKAGRTEGWDWWPQEEITGEQEVTVSFGGHADVMITHECPSGVVHTFPRPPSWWNLADLARSDAHQERLQRIVNAVQPRYLVHGHLHIAYQRVCDFGWGPVEVTGLDCDGEQDNWAVVDVGTMQWL